jgi:hypothetical protein
MGFKTRLESGLRKLGLIESGSREFRTKNVPSYNIGMMKSTMQNLSEIMPGLSQPVWGPEISTVGAYSREGYTSKTFDSPAVPFSTQKEGLQIDEDTQLAINHLSSQVTGGAHYVKAEHSFVVEYFKRFTDDMQFDTFDTIVAKELLWYGNSVWKPRMGIANVRSFKDLMHVPITSFVRIWWDRQRIPYKYEFRGAEYQGYHNPSEIIHFKWNPVNASVFGTGFGVSMTSPRLFQFPVGGGDFEQRELPSLLDRKYATQYTMQHAEQRYVSRNLWVVENGDETQRGALQQQVENLDIGQDVVSGAKVEVQELGSQARNFNPEQFTDLTIGPIFKALNDFRGKQGSSESHQFANARSSAALDEIGLSAFPISLKEQMMEKIFKPWYEANPLLNPETGGLTYLNFKELKLEVEFGKVEKKDIPLQDQIKLLELYINSPLPKDPVVLNNLFVQAGLGITKDMDEQLEQMFSPQNLMAQQMLQQQGMGLTPDGKPDPYYDDNMNLPQHDEGGGEIPDNWDNQRMGSPPMDNPIYDSMMIDVRGDLQNNYKRNPQNQDYQTGRNYE